MFFIWEILLRKLVLLENFIGKIFKLHVIVKCNLSGSLHLQSESGKILW